MECQHKNICFNYPNECDKCRAMSDVVKHYPLLQEKDLVEVVRCGKCRYCAKTKEYDFCTNKHNFIDRRALLVHANHFCSYGKRR